MTVNAVHAIISHVTYSTQTATDLLDKLRDANIDVEHVGSYDSDPAQELKIIKVRKWCRRPQSCDCTYCFTVPLQKKDLRVIIALFEPHTPLARTLWCEVGEGG